MSDEDRKYEPSEDDLQQIREWLRKTPHVIQDYDDEFLWTVILGCKGSLQKTKRVLENLNGLGMRYPEQFGHLDVFNDKLQAHLSVTQLFPLRQLGKDGSVIVISRAIENHDPYKFYICESQRYWLISFYTMFWEHLFGCGKITMVYDWKNMSPIHFREISPVLVKGTAEIMSDLLPIRIQGMHFINVSPILEWSVNVWKTYLKKKIWNRIHIHRSLESLKDYIGEKILPRDYGGSEEDLETLHLQWKKTVESYKDRLAAENDKMRKLDSIRTKMDDFQEMVGTFKVLNID